MGLSSFFVLHNIILGISKTLEINAIAIYFNSVLNILSVKNNKSCYSIHLYSIIILYSNYVLEYSYK